MKKSFTLLLTAGMFLFFTGCILDSTDKNDTSKGTERPAGSSDNAVKSGDESVPAGTNQSGTNQGNTNTTGTTTTSTGTTSTGTTSTGTTSTGTSTGGKSIITKGGSKKVPFDLDKKIKEEEEIQKDDTTFIHG